MQLARSVLFVPGIRASWVNAAHEHDADIAVLDLEDPVPPDKKTRLVKSSRNIPELKNMGQRVHVRINGHRNESDGLTEEDLETVISNELEASVVPKVREPNDVE